MPILRTTGRPPLVRAEILLGCREAADEVGVDLGPIFTAQGIDTQLIASPRGFVEKPRLVNALQAVADYCDCQHFGFLVGKYQPPLKFGPPAQLLKLAPSLRAALENVIHFTELYTQGVSYELFVETREASFRRFNTYHYDIEPVQLDLVGMVQVFKMLGALCGSNWTPSSICFDQSGTREEEQLADFFGCPVLYDAPFAGIAFPAEDLAMQLPGANQELLQIVEAYFAPQLSDKQPADNIVAGTTGYIRRKLGSGLCNLESCAQHLDFHPRTLQRELAENGCTFKQLMLDTRMEMARDHLLGSDMPLSELADMLGYENGSAFSRAFKTRHGLAPLKWRTARRET